MRRYGLGVTLIGVLFAGSSPAADNNEDAREEFRLGKSDYLEGRYEDSIRHYQRAMALKPSPKLHYNIALAYEKIDQPTKALVSYRAYLQAEPLAPNAPEVRQRIAALEKRPEPTPPAPVLPRPPPPPLPTVALPGAVERAPSLVTTGDQPAPRTVAVSFSSTPTWAQLSVDGRPLGITPLSLLMVAGISYQVKLTKPGYLPTTTTVLAVDGQAVSLTLQRSAPGRLRAVTRTEWIGLEPVVGAQSGQFAIGLRVIAFGLRWQYFFWSLLEVGGDLGDYGAADLGTRFGFPLNLGSDGQHQLRLGLGVGYGRVGRLATATSEPSNQGGVGLLLSPSLDYRYHTRGRFFIGGGFRYVGMPIGNLNAGGRSHALLFTVPMGWTPLE